MRLIFGILQYLTKGKFRNSANPPSYYNRWIPLIDELVKTDSSLIKAPSLTIVVLFRDLLPLNLVVGLILQFGS